MPAFAGMTVEGLLSHMVAFVWQTGTHDPAALARRLARLRRLATWLDAAATIPGTGIRFGWDAVLGLLPVGGDALSAALGGYIVLEAARLGVPNRVLLRMMVN